MAVDERSGWLTFPSSRVFECAGLRVGVVEIAATIIDKTMPSYFSEGVRLTNGDDELPGHIHRLRSEEQCDLVDVLSHLSFPQDVKLANQVSSIDILLSGHTHNRLTEPVGIDKTIRIQSGCHGSFVGRLDIEVAEGRVGPVAHRLVPIDATIQPDVVMERMVEDIIRPHAVMLGDIVGHTATALHRNGVFETTMDNLLVDAIAEAAETELVFANGWRYEASVITGPVTMNDLWNILPTNPPVSLVDLTGAELLEMMGQNLERMFSADPFQQMGGFVKRCRGEHLHQGGKPGRTSDRAVFAEGIPLDRSRICTAAYVTAQAVPPRFGRNRHNLSFVPSMP